MSKRELKILLSEAYIVEGELIEFIEECLKEIFKDKSVHAIAQFKDHVENRDGFGCINGLSFLKKQVYGHDHEEQ